MTPGRRGGWACRPFLCAVAALALLVSPVGLVRGQSSCGPHPTAGPAARHWPPPLDRTIALHARDISLRDALDRLAGAAHLRLSYTAELLPLGRRVCISSDSIAVGDALTELLRATPVELVATGADQVVLAPARATADAQPHEQPVAATTSVLDRVVVTGSAIGAPQRSLSVALDVLSGTQVTQRGTGTLSEILDASVPGMWVWEQSPTSILARYGSIRGASSFGVSYPKMYIDGIEVANPLLVSQFIPEMIERVEVIRGPQGAALYGADAISGVINIVTRHDGLDTGAPRTHVRGGAGVAETDFAPHAALAQDHALTLRTGSSLRSLGFGIAGGTVGEFIPGAYNRRISAIGDGRLVHSRMTLTGTARLFAEETGVPVSPVLSSWLVGANASNGRTTGGDTSLASVVADTGAPQSVTQYTLGATAMFAQSERWTHSVVVGLDGYRLTDVPDDHLPIPSAADSALRAATGSADRATMRVSSVAQLVASDRGSAALTLAAEHSILREQTVGDVLTTTPARPDDQQRSATASVVDWRTNTGVIAQLSGALHDAFYLTGGLRVERNDGYTTADHFVALPMVGSAFVHDVGNATIKLRAAYGKGIRPPRTATRETTAVGIRPYSTYPQLSPEEQSGVEAGVDVLLGRSLTLQVTRFDQLASGLIQRVAVTQETGFPRSPGQGGSGGGAPGRRIDYELQNVGEITNRGWEMQSSFALGRLSLGGTLSFVESRVKKLAPGYSGDLRPGDRMLEVPGRTASLNASWSGSGWFGSLTASRASDWINYDRLAIAQAYVDVTRPSQDLVGAWLRNYWREYDGVTRLRGTLSHDIRRGLTLVLTGDNLLDYQRGEPDNVTVLPGRTLTLGLRAGF